MINKKDWKDHNRSQQEKLEGQRCVTVERLERPLKGRKEKLERLQQGPKNRFERP